MRDELRRPSSEKHVRSLVFASKSVGNHHFFPSVFDIGPPKFDAGSRSNPAIAKIERMHVLPTELALNNPIHSVIKELLRRSPVDWRHEKLIFRPISFICNNASALPRASSTGW